MWMQAKTYRHKMSSPHPREIHGTFNIGAKLN